MEIALSILLGSLFGFVLHRVGASNPQNIIQMLRLSDLRLMKAILFGIGASSTLLFLGLAAGWIDPGHLSVKDSSWGVLVGGAMLGLGFGTAGYCPGTGVAALADGRRDAGAFVAGGLGGAFAYMLSYRAVKSTGLLDPIAGGKATLAATGNEAFGSLTGDIPGWLVGAGLGVAFMLIAWLLPSGWGRGRSQPESTSDTAVGARS